MDGRRGNSGEALQQTFPPRRRPLSLAKIFSIRSKKLFPFELNKRTRQKLPSFQVFCFRRSRSGAISRLIVRETERVNRNRSKQKPWTKESQILKSVWTSRHSVTMGFLRRPVNIRGGFLPYLPLLPKKNFYLPSSTRFPSTHLKSRKNPEIPKILEQSWMDSHDRWIDVWPSKHG